MLHVIGIKNCNTVRKALGWFKDNEVEYEFIDLKKEPLTEAELRELEMKVGLDVLVNKRGMTYRKLGLKEKNLNNEELFQELLKNQMMIKRPVLIKNQAVIVGFDEDSYSSFLLENNEE